MRSLFKDIIDVATIIAFASASAVLFSVRTALAVEERSRVWT